MSTTDATMSPGAKNAAMPSSQKAGAAANLWALLRIDQHVIYAIALFALAAAAAGDHWGLGTAWRRTRLVQRFPLLA
jgi:hypothetical protein